MSKAKLCAHNFLKSDFRKTDKVGDVYFGNTFPHRQVDSNEEYPQHVFFFRTEENFLLVIIK